MKKENKRIDILGVSVDVLTAKETVELVKQYVNEKKFLHLMGVNADKILSCLDNDSMKKIVNSCEVINADGASVVMASRFLKKELPERVAGIDLMQDLIADAEKNDYSVYFLGAKQEVVEKTVTNLLQEYPNLNVVGFRNGYFKESEWKQISKELKDTNPSYVFVGITSPIKEYLIEYLKEEGNNSVFMGVGGSFDVISGYIKRAPLLIQKLNLEWLYRVYQEPVRLFKRYYKGNVRFIKLILREKRG
ncbi:WecB/TagA/CpsF family glycosyltransferase [Enterococcus saccharolyticus]|uniref:WecB/TagA/CpsF family glycosyltransferase n=1 Tax=Enterococcus saccharolyticus TaxID=41997 RepID=UPI001E624F29|nr:WecB/TagA/CpsF family glycosyltransferase [Enterococcus saccharolyticus]MCD5001689.1 WecB/TagA/CpsF family glycosyltransferase [Enterococcus saccharolyticus]